MYSPITYFLLPITLFILEDSTNQPNTNNQQPTTNNQRPVSSVLLVVGRFGWKPIPSEARVTRDEVSGFPWLIVTAVWKTVPPRAKHPRQSDKSVFEKKLSGETNTDYKDITDFIKWWYSLTERNIRVNQINPCSKKNSVVKRTRIIRIERMKKSQ